MVSIIVPSYNAVGLLSETLENVLQQTYANWECLIIDDGSTDNTRDIAELFVKRDNRFQYYYQNNGGLSSARNYGIELSKGEFIQLLDSDDMLEKYKLQRQVEILESDKDCDIVYGNSSYFEASENGLPQQIIEKEPNWQKKVSGKGDIIISTLLQGNIMVVHSPLLRKKIFNVAGLYDKELKSNEDWDLWLRCALKGIVFRYDDSPQTKALTRVHPGNMSKDLFKMYLNGLKVCIKISQLVELNKYKKILKRKVIFHQKYLEMKIKENYLRNENKGIEMNAQLYSATKLPRYRRYSMVMENMPAFIYLLYYKLQYLILTGKYKTIYVS